MTSSTSSAFTPARFNASLMATPPRSHAVRLERDPPNFPKAVRAPHNDCSIHYEPLQNSFVNAFNLFMK